MAATITQQAYQYPNGIDETFRRANIQGRFIIGSGTYVTNGLPITWFPMTEYQSGAAFIAPTSMQVPCNGAVQIYSIVNGVALYTYDPVHNTVRITIAGAELANAATLPGSVTGDTIEFYAEFIKGKNL